MSRWFDSITDLETEAERLRAARHGTIEVVDGCLHRIVLRPWGKRVSWCEARLAGRLVHAQRRGDLCRLYWTQPAGFPWCLTLSYVVSHRDASFGTFRRAVTLLDEVARVKGCQTLLCDVSNVRISDRLLARWGWQPHAAMRWHRNYVKRLDQPTVIPRAEAESLLAAVD
jgi:hypothetical protein